MFFAGIFYKNSSSKFFPKTHRSTIRFETHFAKPTFQNTAKNFC